ncbi:MAG: tetA 1 [Gammaproteobacteria bacterium]|jgi:predicted MFS family arabinose efflux permease|nr:tetA 1 [Gammaproteobacteria bacterium]
MSAAPLFLVLFIDSMGLGLVFPILNALVIDPHSYFIASEASTHFRNLLYGFTISIFMFCWFFGAAFLGNLSDQLGRKKSLLICLVGACAGYLISALAVLVNSYTLLLIGRIIAGFTAGSQSIAQAAIVDISEPDQKARNLGLILFFCSLGFVVGPMIGGILSASTLIYWFNYAVPFYFAALISFINAILLAFIFKETFLRTNRKLHFKLHYAVEIFIQAFKHEKICGLSIVFLVMIFGWSSIYSFISMYLLHKYHFSSLENGFYMALLGIGFGIGTGFLMDPLTKRFSLKQCMIGSCLLIAAITTLIITAPAAAYVWVYDMFLGAIMAVCYSAMLTLFSNQVDEKSQGWVMGITGAVMAFAFGLNGLLMGILANLDSEMPLIIAIISLTFSALLMQRLYHDPALVNT